LAKIGKNWQKLAKIGKNWQKLAKIGKNCDHNIGPRLDRQLLNSVTIMQQQN
jgi:hypothetical protein